MVSRQTASAKFELTIEGSITNTLTSGKATVASLIGESLLDAFGDGVQQLEMNRAWEEFEITILSGATLDLDLRTMALREIGAGIGKDALGQDNLFEEIVALIVRKTGGAGVLEINPTLPAQPVTWIPLNAARDALGGGLKTDGIRAWYESDEQGFDTTATEKNIRFGAVDGDVVFSLQVFGRDDDDDSSSSSSSISSSSVSSQSSSSSSSSSPSSTSLSSQSSSSSSISTSSSSQSSSSISTSSSSQSSISTSSISTSSSSQSSISTSSSSISTSSSSISTSSSSQSSISTSSSSP